MGGRSGGFMHIKKDGHTQADALRKGQRPCSQNTLAVRHFGQTFESEVPEWTG